MQQKKNEEGLIENYMDEKVEENQNKRTDKSFGVDLAQIKNEMEKETKRDVLIALCDNYVGKVITSFQGQKVVLIETVVNVMSYHQQFILYKYFD